MAAAATGQEECSLKGSISEEGARKLWQNYYEGAEVIGIDGLKYSVANNECTDPGKPYCNGAKCLPLGHNTDLCGNDKPPCDSGSFCFDGQCEANCDILKCSGDAECKNNDFVGCTSYTKVCVLNDGDCLSHADCKSGQCNRNPGDWQCAEE